NGGWAEDPDVVTERLMAAASVTHEEVVDSKALRTYMGLLTQFIRTRLVVIRGRRWSTPNPAPHQATIVARLGVLIRQAARLRQENRLLGLERALGFVAGGHTAGEEMLLESLAEAPDQGLVSGLSRAGPSMEWGGIEVRLTGLIVFGP
ncbi:MAG TPA: hypothetical protein VJ808_11295, partial [Gemmatimonadales bacterium]|nr:hypothetical protein [Gemmatimonadales bacterium]